MVAPRLTFNKRFCVEVTFGPRPKGGDSSTADILFCHLKSWRGYSPGKEIGCDVFPFLLETES